DPPTVVDDLESQRAFLTVDDHGRLGRTSVLQHVGQRFLHDSVGSEVDAGWKVSAGAFGPDVHFEAGIAHVPNQAIELGKPWSGLVRSTGLVSKHAGHAPNLRQRRSTRV